MRKKSPYYIQLAVGNQYVMLNIGHSHCIQNPETRSHTQHRSCPDNTSFFGHILCSRLFHRGYTSIFVSVLRF